MAAQSSYVMSMDKARDINLHKKLEGKNLIVFDGECVLCSRFFAFVLRADKQNRFSFATAQSQFGEALYHHYGLKAQDYDTNLVILDGVLFERLHGFFECMKILGWPYKALAAFGALPDRFLDWAYYRIARNRYKLFGKRETCLVPDKDISDRFVNE